ncbi:MAG: phospho-sugar mutase [Mycobacteriales bacterium]
MDDVRARAEAWLAEDPDSDTRTELRAALDDPDRAGEVAEWFSGRLAFGTAGLRGPLRPGPMGMNRAVVRRAAAGLAAYLTGKGETGRVVVGFDARHKSDDFARDTAAVLTGAGFEVLVMARPLPTPVLAYAVRRLGCVAGVMVTASHNPPEDNGYKVYLGDGAQLVPPADTEIEAAIAAVGPLASVPMGARWTTLGEDILEDYLTAVTGLLDPTAPRDLRIAYTPLHGVGGAVLREAFARAGFGEPETVPAQAEPDPDFPTVAFPNPEEPGATDLLLTLAGNFSADLAIANDPDADRCAVLVGGRMLRGDEVGALLADHLIRRGRHGVYATTVVSSSLLSKLAAARGRPYAETLTGFKWIMKATEDVADLAYGYEEALGYAVAPGLVRDKDGISAALLVAELAATLKAEGRTLRDRLDELAREFGLHATDQLSVRVSDLNEIGAMMARLRADPPARLLDEPVTEVTDRLPEADVLTLRADGLRVVVRPSGTEPKLKAYLEVVIPAEGPIDAARVIADNQLHTLRADVAAALGVSN